MSVATDEEGQLLRKILLAKGTNKPVIESYDFFVQHRISKILSAFQVTTIDGSIVKFENPIFSRPTIIDLKGNGRARPLFPYEARRKGLSYMAELCANLRLYRRIPIQPDPNDPNQQIRYELKLAPDGEIKVTLGKIPVLLHSVLDRLKELSPTDRVRQGESEKDPGAYFIIKGAEKVLLNIEKLRTAYPHLYEDTSKSKNRYVIRYTSQTLTDTSIVMVFESKDDVHATINVNNDGVNIFYIFYALGITSNTIESVYRLMDAFIVDQDEQRQTQRRQKLRYYLQSTANTFMTQSDLNHDRIIRLLAEKFNYKDIPNVLNRNTLVIEKIRADIFKNIPMDTQNREEISAIVFAKIRMLSYMIVKYVEFKNGYRDIDDRDSWGNKRLVDPGGHMETKFIQFWKQMISNIQKEVTQNQLTTPIQIKKSIKHVYMTEHFINAISKGLWGSGRGGREINVVDTLKRDTLLATWAHIRRISAPTRRRAPIRDKRLIHTTQWGAVCPVMTPEGEACLDISTQIILADGNVEEIGKLKNGDEILTIDPITLEQRTTKITNHFIKSSENYGKSILKIVTLSDREIICTDDHPFYTQSGWIYARDLDLKTHVLGIYPNVVSLPHTTESLEYILTTDQFAKKLRELNIKSSLISKYTCDLETKNLLPLCNNSECLPILSRIAGFLLADGRLGLSSEGVPYSSFCFGTEYDGSLFLQDIAKLGFDQNKLRNAIVDKGREVVNNVWKLYYGGCFASLLLALDITYGKRAEVPSVPTWIMNGSQSVRREFVSGFQGGDGSEIIWTKRSNKVKAGKFNFSCALRLRNKRPEYIESLFIFMNQIAEICREFGIKILSVKKISESATCSSVRINFSDKEENIIRYMEIIGYRYATTASTRGYYIAEYLKYKHSKLNNKENGRTLAPKETLGFEQWNKCSTAQNNCVFVPIKSIIPDDPCFVADFTTESDTHSMVSNGFITHNCGLVKDSALTAYVSLERDEDVVKTILGGNPKQNVPSSYSTFPRDDRVNSLFLNGIHLGFCNSRALKQASLEYRRQQRFDFDTAIFLDTNKDLWIYTNAGRICRPLLLVDHDSQELVIDLKHLRGQSLLTLMQQGAIEYIDILEQEQPEIYIAETVRHLRAKRARIQRTAERYQELLRDPDAPPEEVENSRRAYETYQNEMRYTHAEIDPTAILGISASTIPLPEFNPAPRDTYQAQMAKQALGPNSSRIELRFDTTMRTMNVPGVPLFTTDAHETLGLDEYPAGQNILIAITTYGGQNQEDALIVNELAVKLGLFRMTIFHGYKTTICQAKTHQERIQVPDFSEANASKYAKLDLTTGIVRVGQYVEEGDCLVGKVIITTEDGKTEVKDDSLYVEVNKKGVVDEVSITENAESLQLIRVRLREVRNLQPGDKLASRYAQKGIVGEILPYEKMPIIVSDNEALNGLRPNIIFNPHGIPSRMTIGKMIEILTGKYAAATGERINATAFRQFNWEGFRDQLEILGFSRSGKERMINGVTGRVMDAEIFVGPVYYQLLRHLVEDKMQARATGAVQFLTRQPLGGIRRGGGLRFGEMERDALIGHGASYLLQERLMISSDAYTAVVCEECGVLAIANAETGDFRCRACHSGQFGRLTIPYIWKVLTQILSAANIKVSLKTREI